MSCKRTSLHPVPSFEHRRSVCAKVLSVDWRINLAMPPPSKRVHETESTSSASAPKRIRGSDPVMNSHCFTWQNASLKEPDEDTERYLWRMPTPTVESEPVPTPISVGAAIITKYDLMMIEFDRDGKNWTVTQRSKHYSVTRMVLRDRIQSVKFMLIVTDPPYVSTREIIKISHHVHLSSWYRVWVG